MNLDSRLQRLKKKVRKKEMRAPIVDGLLKEFSHKREGEIRDQVDKARLN